MVDITVITGSTYNNICFNVQVGFFSDHTHTQTQNLETYCDLTSVLSVCIFLLIELIVPTLYWHDIKSSTFLCSFTVKNLVLKVDGMDLHQS